MVEKNKIAVIGGGSWATAIVKILSESADNKVKWWLRDPKDIAHLKEYHRNPSYLSDVYISPKRVAVYSNIKEAVKGVNYIVLAIPSAFIEEPIKKGLTSKDFDGKRVISAIKGMIPQTKLLVTDWIAQEYGVPTENLGIIGGPCHAEEVAQERQSYLTVASAGAACAAEFSEILSCRYVIANPLDDLLGVELSAVMKNIVALANGITHGLGYGDNFQAVLVSNALQEIQRFLDAVDPRARNVNSSAYLGDLLVTSYSQFSRNRFFGNMIGRGYSVQTAQLEMKMIAEGYYAAKSIYDMNREVGVFMPISDMVYHVLYDGACPSQAVEVLKRQFK